jgi:4-amino-4-deoxy-L-arabinose transferase-like glycosyltransferase
MSISSPAEAPAAVSRRELLVLLAILLITFGLRMVFVHQPLERDEGLYAYIGQEILRGAIPYRDMADLKPPGSFYLYAAIIALFGNTLEAIRVATGIYSMATAFFVYRIARYLQGWQAGVAAGLLFAFFSGTPLMQGSGSNTEVLMILPLVIGVYLALRGSDTGSLLHFAGSGLFAGFAVMVKTVALPYAAALFLFVLLRPGPGDNRRRRLVECGVFVAPPLATVLLACAYFAWHGALHDMYYWNVTIHKLYVQHEGGNSFRRLVVTSTVLLREQALLWGSALGGGLWLALGRRDRKGVFVALLLPVACIAVALPGHFFPHYFIQLAPFCAVAGGVLLGLAWQRRGWLLAVCLTLVISGFASQLNTDYNYYFVYSPAEVSRMAYGNYPLFGQSVEIARYVRERTGPDDYIIQWGFEPELLFYSNRRTLANLTTFLGLEWAPDPAGATARMLADLEAKKPKYIIVQDSFTDAAGARELSDVVKRDYFLERRLHYAQLFRRKDVSQ